MNIRFAVILLGAAVIAVPDAQAQGHPQRHAVLSDSVMKAMIARKPKTKTPLTARIPAMRRSLERPVSKSAQPAPASVTAIRKTSRK